MSPKDIIGISEIASLCRVNRATVCMWRKRYKDFPQPVANLKCGPIFSWNHVKKWLNMFETERPFWTNQYDFRR